MAIQRERLVRIVYMCYLCVGIVFVLGHLANLVTLLFPSQAESLGSAAVFFVLVPLLGLTFLLRLVGIIGSLILWQEWPLILMSLISILTWARDSLSPELCTGIWTVGLCTELSYASSGFAFLALSIWALLLKRQFARPRRAAILGLVVMVLWTTLIVAVDYDDIRAAVAVLGRTNAPDCVSAHPPAITPECSTRVAQAGRRLNLFTGWIVIPPLAALALASARALVRRGRPGTARPA